MNGEWIRVSKPTSNPNADSLYDGAVVGRGPGDAGTQYHADSPAWGVDRVGQLVFWVALDEVTPEMGAMRFLTGSHREGPLGLGAPVGGEANDPLIDLAQSPMLVRYPKLLELFPLSPPFHYQPGDVTVHTGFMVHGSPSNKSDRQRWHWQVGYCAADTQFPNGGVRPEDGCPRATLSDNDKYPIVYPVKE